MPIQIPQNGKFGYDVTLKYANSGAHDVICGVSLAAGGSGNYNIHCPWFVVFNQPVGTSVRVTIPNISASGLPLGTYDALACAGETYTPGTKISDLIDQYSNVVGALYQAGTGAPHGFDPQICSVKMGELIIGGAGVSAQILSFNLVV